jgi:hypothetical protein
MRRSGKWDIEASGKLAVMILFDYTKNAFRYHRKTKLRIIASQLHCNGVQFGCS